MERAGGFVNRLYTRLMRPASLQQLPQPRQWREVNGASSPPRAVTATAHDQLSPVQDQGQDASASVLSPPWPPSVGESGDPSSLRCSHISPSSSPRRLLLSEMAQLRATVEALSMRLDGRELSLQSLEHLLQPQRHKQIEFQRQQQQEVQRDQIELQRQQQLELQRWQHMQPGLEPHSSPAVASRRLQPVALALRGLAAALSQEAYSGPPSDVTPSAATQLLEPPMAALTADPITPQVAAFASPAISSRRSRYGSKDREDLTCEAPSQASSHVDLTCFRDIGCQAVSTTPARSVRGLSPSPRPSPRPSRPSPQREVEGTLQSPPHASADVGSAGLEWYDGPSNQDDRLGDRLESLLHRVIEEGSKREMSPIKALGDRIELAIRRLEFSLHDAAPSRGAQAAASLGAQPARQPKLKRPMSAGATVLRDGSRACMTGEESVLMLTDAHAHQKSTDPSAGLSVLEQLPRRDAASSSACSDTCRAPDLRMACLLGPGASSRPSSKVVKTAPRPAYIAACGVLHIRLARLLDPDETQQKALGLGGLKALMGAHCAIEFLQAKMRSFLAKQELLSFGSWRPAADGQRLPSSVASGRADGGQPGQLSFATGPAAGRQWGPSRVLGENKASASRRPSNVPLLPLGGSQQLEVPATTSPTHPCDLAGFLEDGESQVSTDREPQSLPMETHHHVHHHVNSIGKSCGGHPASVAAASPNLRPVSTTPGHHPPPKRSASVAGRFQINRPASAPVVSPNGRSTSPRPLVASLKLVGQGHAAGVGPSSPYRQPSKIGSAGGRGNGQLNGQRPQPRQQMQPRPDREVVKSVPMRGSADGLPALAAGPPRRRVKPHSAAIVAPSQAKRLARPMSACAFTSEAELVLQSNRAKCSHEWPPMSGAAFGARPISANSQRPISAMSWPDKRAQSTPLVS